MLQGTTFRPGCPNHFQVSLLENGWGNSVETSYHAVRSRHCPKSDAVKKKKSKFCGNREVLHSVRRNFLDGMLRSGCEFRKLFPKRSLKRSIETESERNSVDHFRKGTVLVDRVRQHKKIFFGSFLFLFPVCSATWLLKGSNCGST